MAVCVGSHTVLLVYMTGCETTQENQQYLNCIHSMNYAEVINPRRACAARVTVVVLCVCVCLSVRSISATTSKSKPQKRYQRFIATRQREKN